MHCLRHEPSRPDRLRPRQRASTLLELVIVIVVLAILAALAVTTHQNVIMSSQDQRSEARRWSPPESRATPAG